MHVEVPSASWLVGRIGNLFYRLSGSGYVVNLSPMHPPYHLYEFKPQSFLAHARSHGCSVAFHQFHVCQTYAPRWLDALLASIMRATNTGMQLEVWLSKDSMGD